MKNLRCIAIDDNRPSLDLLESYAKKVSFIELVETFTNPLDAMNKFDELDLDLIFLDVEMPEISGIKFLETKQPKQMIVFLTDFKQYAFDSYDLKNLYNINVIDYLSKPITIEKFYRAANKAFEYYKQSINKHDENFIFLQDGNKTYKINYDDIIYIKGNEQYPDIYLFNNRKSPINIRITLKELEEQLPKNQFIRIEKSYIISIKYIERFESPETVWIKDGSKDGKNIAIGDKYKDGFKIFLKKYKIN